MLSAVRNQYSEVTKSLIPVMTGAAPLTTPKPHPSSSAYSFRKRFPPMIRDRILLIASISWCDGDGFHSPAHRVRPGARGPWQDDPPRSDSRHWRGRPRGRRDHAAHPRDRSPACGNPRDVRGPRPGTIVPYPPPPLHRYPSPRGLLDLARPRRCARPPPRPPHRRQRGIPSADDREPEHPPAVQDPVRRRREADRHGARTEEARAATV